MKKDRPQVSASQRMQSAAIREFIILLVIFLLAATLAVRIDLFERVHDVLEKYDRFEIDEFLIVLSLFSLLITMYAYRRWQDTRIALTARMHTDETLKAANRELERKAEALERHNRQSEKLARLASHLQICKTREEIFRFSSQTAAQLFRGTDGAIYIMENAQERMVIVAEWGASGRNPESIDTDDCMALRLGRRYTSHPALETPKCAHVSDPAGSTTCIPLSAAGELFGLLHMGCGTRRECRFDQTASTLLDHASDFLAEKIALALSNLSLQTKLRDMAIHDQLTGVYNRQYLEEAFEKELHRARRHRYSLAVVMIDLDHFKTFNDSFGHAAGDFLLQAMGRLLTDFFRAQDFCFRYGGEEFFVLLAEINRDELEARCEKLRRRIGNLDLSYHQRPLGQITASVGAALFPDNGLDYASLLEAADEALYEAKRQGRNQIRLARTTPAL